MHNSTNDIETKKQFMHGDWGLVCAVCTPALMCHLFKCLVS